MSIVVDVPNDKIIFFIANVRMGYAEMYATEKRWLSVFNYIILKW